MTRQYRIYDRGPKKPSRCIVTQSTSDPLIDLERDIPGYGRVYLSVRELAQIGFAHGFLSPRQSDELRTELYEAKLKLAALPALLEAHRDSLAAADRDFADGLAAAVGSELFRQPLAPEEAVDGDGDADEGDGADAGDGAAGDADLTEGSDEPRSDAGPDGVREPAGDDADAGRGKRKRPVS